ncbi:uncharacterized protein A4U43_C06F1890 [Asparagus officinalis]|uniref:Ataxin 2 SM domain-containing protein n=1 Tax=Asparagus officinalis TaxID=4686 RepID=A0A5P1EKZ9_ASPOF|nr:polyadenylate-binding protein-interacting protein 4-like isoform X2 [Asparagus officinalis]ONK65877.1 uncharacterized protein A4U43_C06F1890 [Asparagus officinalis]
MVSKNLRDDEYLLYVAICMVGLPVEVQVKDGSSYSGILHTASFDENHGIVLKKARKIGKGKDERNFPVGSTVDTLVVFLVDLVQVVVKDFLLPAEGMSTSAASDAIASGTISVSEKASEQSVSSDSSPSGQVGDDMPKGEGTSCNHVDEASETKQIECKVHPMPPSNVDSLQLDFVDDTHTANASNEPSKPDYQPESISTNSRNYPSLDTQASAVCRHSSSVSNSRTSSCTGLSTSPNVSYSQNNSSCKPTKEFKLNPGAKVFSPMSANARLSPTSVPTNTNAGYITSYPPAIPIAAVQSGVQNNSFASRSTPAKLVQYDGLVTGHGAAPVQYSRPVLGHANAWQQPVRLSGQHHPVQALPTYMQPTSQMVMIGRTGQLVYLHPVAQDVTQGAPVLSQGSPYPLLNPCQTNLPKIQGALAAPFQLSLAPPLVTAPAAHSAWPHSVISIVPSC